MHSHTVHLFLSVHCGVHAPRVVTGCLTPPLAALAAQAATVFFTHDGELLPHCSRPLPLGRRWRACVSASGEGGVRLNFGNGLERFEYDVGAHEAAAWSEWQARKPD